jgi:Fe-S-cluster containining protein
MVFICRQCGTCCMYMGDYIVIEHQIGPFEFAGESVSTGTPFIACIDDDKREIFLDRTFPDQHPAACRFLRPDGDRVRCTIHKTSPAQCKFYRCLVMRVLDSQGVLLGTVRGTLDLHSDNPGLRAVWETAEREISHTAGDREERLQQYLENHGYQVE